MLIVGIDMETAARNLVFRGITLITVNYRLGPFGFMSITHADNKIEGNFGIYDQKLALEWVQRNIKVCFFTAFLNPPKIVAIQW